MIRKSIYRVVLLAVVVLGIGAPAAIAEPFGPTEEAAWDQAGAFWGRPPAICTSIVTEVVPNEALELSNGEVAFPNRPAPCFVYVAGGLSEYQLCLTSRSLYGLLLGYATTSPVLSQTFGCLRSPIERMRERHLSQRFQCYELPSKATKRQLIHCWSRSRRTLQRLLAAMAER